MSIRRVVPIVTVDDIDAARDLYVDVFGATEIMNHGWIITLAADADGSHQFSVMAEDATAPCNPSVSVEVDDVDRAYRTAVAAGADIVHDLTDEAWGVRRFFFRDPSGNVVNVLAHRHD